MADRIPYVYWLKNKTTGKKYIGVKYAKGCSPDTFWVDYFTSSSQIHKLIDLYGKEDFEFKVLHRFNTVQDAILKEEQYVKLAIKREDYLNVWHYKAPMVDLCSYAGTIGGNVQVQQKLGIHKQTKLQRLKILKKARAVQLKTKKNAFVNCDREIQAGRGRRGGVKNKGFKWYTDGQRGYKYTKEQQTQLSFERFLLNNPQFKHGRI